MIGKHIGNETISDELLDEYMHTRALIDQTELDVLFSYNKEFDYEGIIISCERLNKFLNPEIVSVLEQINKKKIWILYEEKEFKIEKTLEERFGDKIEKVFDRPITVFEGRIEFDSEAIKSKMANTIKAYGISFSLSKPKSPKKEQKKYNTAEKRDAIQSYKKYKYKKKNK